jgi:hypothetical protein
MGIGMNSHKKMLNPATFEPLWKEDNLWWKQNNMLWEQNTDLVGII